MSDGFDFDFEAMSKYALSILSYYESLTPKVLPSLSPRNDIAKNFYQKTPRNSIRKSVVAVSTFVGVQRKIDCSGLIVDCGSGQPRIITSAKAFRFPPTSLRKFYNIIVRLFNGKVFKAEEEYIDFRINVALIKMIDCQEPLEAIKLDWNKPSEDQFDIYVLGRDFHTFASKEVAGKLLKHPPCFGCDELLATTARTTNICEGGPVITESGVFMGINFVDDEGYAHLLPSESIVCMLHSVWHIRDVLYPWFGLTVIDAQNVSPDAQEMLGLSSHDERLLVKEVYSGSHAEELGICPGDLVISRHNLVEHVQELFKTSKMMCSFLILSGYVPDETASPLEILRHSGGETVFVKPEYLSGQSKNFCHCWPFDDKVWGREPLKGSQKDPIVKSWNPCRDSQWE